MIEERVDGHSSEGIQGSGIITKSGNISEMNRGIALRRNTEEIDNVYKHTYIWDEENRIKTTIDPAATVEYRYDSQDAWPSSRRSLRPGSGERTNKRSEGGNETLYFNSMWLVTEDSYDFRMSKNIYLGETRIATRLNMEIASSVGYAEENTYYYHPDHLGCIGEQKTKSVTSLGSSNIVTTPDGEVFEHIEYTPKDACASSKRSARPAYGEIWIDKSSDISNMLPYKFTAKELDEETGLYYYGARYLNPRTSRWISSDPAGFDLINPMKDGNPRNGYSIVEATNWYSYVSNNPIKYLDPSGMEHVDSVVLTFTRYRTPEQSMNNANSNGQDEAYLYTENGGSIITVFQASATRETAEGNNDSIKSGSKVTFKMFQGSKNTMGISLLIMGGETEDCRRIGTNGIPEGSSEPNTAHGNSLNGDDKEYNSGVLESEGCPVGKIKSHKELIGKLLDAGVEPGDTFGGYIVDFIDTEAP